MTQHLLQLYLKTSNRIVVSGDKLAIVLGVHAGKKEDSVITVGAIIFPTAENPRGLITYAIDNNATVGSWKECYPEVVNCEFRL